jgi:hypothetical protein
MKKALTFFISLLLTSCSKPDKEQMISNSIEITELSQKKVRIGDTLIIRGKNLDLVSNFRFEYTDDDKIILADPLEKKKDFIKVIIPELHYENFNLLTIRNGSLVNSTPLNLIGTFPLRFNSDNDNLKYDNIGTIKMVSEKIAFTTAGKKLYKTTDGGYNWKEMKIFEQSKGFSMFFLDENNGWIAIQDGIKFTLHYTEDGGNTFNKIFEKEDFNFHLSSMNFSSPTNGYLITSKAKVYQTNDNSNFNLIYDSLANATGADFSFNTFSFFNNNLIAAGYNSYNGKSILLQRINNTFNYSILDTWTWDIQLINETEAYISNNINNNLNNEENIFFSSNLESGNWEKAGNQYIKYFHFINKNKGIGIRYEKNLAKTYHVVFETFDGGKNWINKFSFRDFQFITSIDFYNNIGIITGLRGKIWKHIIE